MFLPQTTSPVSRAAAPALPVRPVAASAATAPAVLRVSTYILHSVLEFSNQEFPNFRIVNYNVFKVNYIMLIYA